MSPRPALVRGGGSRMPRSRVLRSRVSPSRVGQVARTGLGGPAGLVARLGLAGLAGLGLAGCAGGGAVDVTTPSPAPSGEVRSLCSSLIGALPDTVADDLASRQVSPSDALTAAWGDPAVVLRCGVPKPAALTRTSACFEVNGVGWLVTQHGQEVSGDDPVDETLTFTTIGRTAYVEVAVPPMDDHQAADPLPALASAITADIPLNHPCH